MSEPFITIAEAVKMTGKSRRTIQRLVESLVKAQPDQVMKEKTTHGYIWRVSQESVRRAYGGTHHAVHPQAEANQSLPVPASNQLTQVVASEKYFDVALQGYTGIMTMHEEVKQAYEERLKDKDIQIAQLTQDLIQARKGIWARLFA